MTGLSKEHNMRNTAYDLLLPCEQESDDKLLRELAKIDSLMILYDYYWKRISEEKE